MEENFEPKLGDEIPENLIKKAEKEISQEYRMVILNKFRDKENVEIHIYHPTPGVDGIASDAYTKAFSKLIKDDDLMTRKQMLKLVADKGIWGAEQEKKIEDISEDMRVIEIEVATMRKKGNFNKARMNKLRSDWIKLRQQRNDLFAEKTQILSNTVEGRAEEEEIKVKLSLCVKYPDGSLVWNSLDELNNDKERIQAVRIANEAMLFWSGLTQEIIDTLPVQLLFGGEGKESEKLQDN